MNKKIMITAAVAAIFLLSIVYSQIPNFAQGDIFTQAGSGQGYGPLVNTIILAIAGMSFAVSLIYMASRVAHVPEWEEYAKSEMFQMVIGVLWGIFIFSGALVIDGIVTDYMSNMGAGYAGQSLFDVGEKYLQDTICVSSATTLKLEGMKMAAQYMAGMKSRFYAAAVGWGFSIPTFPGFDVIERAIDLILMFISPFAASLLVQYLGMQLIHATALTVVLPAGILMRVFSPTRDAGSFLIAAALAFYFVLPFCYLINAQVMYYLYYEEFEYQMCSGGESQTSDYLFTSKDFYSSLRVQMLPKLSQDFVGTGAFTNHLSYVIVQAVFLPAINMIMVVTFVKTGMKFFSQKFEL